MEWIENIVLNLQQIDAVVLIFKLILIVILAGLIGWEREYCNKPAGLRTHVLLGVSAVLIAYLGVKIYNETGADATRIPAQLLSGIGFLGAGTILREGFNVKGLTTAASLLTVTCIGLCIGFGAYITAIIATLVVYIILSYSHIVSENLGKFTNIKLEITCDNPKDIINDVKEIFEENKIDILKLNIHRSERKSYLDLEGRSSLRVDKNALISKIMSISDIIGVSDVEFDK